MWKFTERLLLQATNAQQEVVNFLNTSSVTDEPLDEDTLAALMRLTQLSNLLLKRYTLAVDLEAYTKEVDETDLELAIWTYLKSISPGDNQYDSLLKEALDANNKAKAKKTKTMIQHCITHIQLVKTEEPKC